MSRTQTADSFLIGGGREPGAAARVLAHWVQRLGSGRVACVVADEGDGVDGPRWTGLVSAGGAAQVELIVVAAGRPLGASALDGAAGVFVAGGLTPLYAQLVRDIPSQLPYAGFSAGAAIAPSRAVVGGWRAGERAVCPEDAAEDLDEVAVVDGLGRVPFAVDVHAAQWGTLGRLVHAVGTGLVLEGWAIDEHTALDVVDGRVAAVVGDGAAHHVRATGGGGVTVDVHPGGR